MACFPSRVDVKAIRVPSGERTGLALTAASARTGCTLLPSASIKKMPGDPVSRVDWKTIWVLGSGSGPPPPSPQAAATVIAAAKQTAMFPALFGAGLTEDSNFVGVSVRQARSGPGLTTV